MRELLSTARAFSAATLPVILAACSAGSSSPSGSPFAARGMSLQRDIGAGGRPELVLRPAGAAENASSPRRADPQMSLYGGTVWISDLTANKVDRCRKRGCKPIGTGWSEPQGLAADAAGDIYVADTGNERIVELDENGRTLAILSDLGEYPAGVGVALDGTVGVTNICNAPSCIQGNIVFYAPGAISPTRTATGLQNRFYSGAFDAAGNFYNSGTDSYGHVRIGVVATGSTTDTDTGLGSDIGFPGGVQVASGAPRHLADTLLVGDQDQAIIHAYSLPHYGSLGSISLSGACDVITFGLSHANRFLWTSDECTNSYIQYAYPAGGAPLASIPGYGDPIGVVVLEDGED